MVDDLVTRGVSEPYRMFTSRAEFRLHLRSDNADQRLTPLGRARGLVGERRGELFEARRDALGRGRTLLEGLKASPSAARRAGMEVNADGVARSAFDLLSYASVTPDSLAVLWPEIGAVPAAILEQIEIDAKYAVYLDRQKADVEAVRRDEGREIPSWIDYAELTGLSIEVRQKLASARPTTIAQAQAIDGVTPAAITLLLSVMRRGALRKAG